MAAILVIDHEPTLRTMLRLALERDGHHVRCAADGLEALRLQHLQPADLVVCDIGWPWNHGLEILQTFRALPQPPRLIATSALSSVCGPLVDFLTRAQALGVTVLRKPFSILELSTLIRKTLRTCQG